MHEAFAEWFKQKRKEKGMLQPEIAKEIGVTTQTIVAVEKGNSLSVKTIRSIAAFFEIPVEKVFKIYSK